MIRLYQLNQINRLKWIRYFTWWFNMQKKMNNSLLSECFSSPRPHWILARPSSCRALPCPTWAAWALAPYYQQQNNNNYYNQNRSGNSYNQQNQQYRNNNNNSNHYNQNSYYNGNGNTQYNQYDVDPIELEARVRLKRQLLHRLIKSPDVLFFF